MTDAEIETGSGWSDLLVCDWTRWDVVDSKSLRVYLEGWADLAGTVRTATMLMPDVATIEIHVNEDGRGSRIRQRLSRKGDKWTLLEVASGGTWRVMMPPTKVL